MKLSKLNMSLENNSAEEEKEEEVSCHDVCATRHSLSLSFFSLTLLFRVTNVIQKIQGLSLPVFYIGTIWLHELFQLRRKKGAMAIEKKGEVT